MRHVKQRGGPAHMQGFTLIEVLIALAIVAIALGAVLRAIGALGSNVETARTRLLALWSADNVLSEITIAQQCDVALDVEQQLLKTGKVSRGSLGVAVQEVSQALAHSFGLSKADGGSRIIDPAGDGAGRAYRLEAWRHCVGGE